MNLAQAYQGWQQQSQNRDLYVKTREAFRKAWFTLPTNKPCSYYTKEVLGEALAETRVIESSKAKAASVMIHVLTFANFAEPKFNPKPDFTFNDLMEYTKGPLADPEKVKPKEKPSCLDDDDHDLDYDPVTDAPRRAMAQEAQPSDTVGTVPAAAKGEDDSTEGLSPSVSPAPESGKPDYCDGCNNVKGCITCVDGDQRAVIREVKPKSNEDMKPKKERKPAGRKARPLAQIHPDTLEVVKVWPSLSEAERETGACNLDRVITLLRKSVGFYWCNAEDADTFKARLDEKKQKTAERQKQHAASMREKKSAIEQEKRDAGISTSEREQARPQVKASAQPKPKKESSTESTQGTVPAVTSVSPVGEHATSHQGQSPCAPANAASKALAVFTDDELLAELDRRGWQGELCRTQVVAIGV